jgi:hypothetical protein
MAGNHVGIPLSSSINQNLSANRLGVHACLTAGAISATAPPQMTKRDNRFRGRNL